MFSSSICKLLHEKKIHLQSVVKSANYIDRIWPDESGAFWEEKGGSNWPGFSFDRGKACFHLTTLAVDKTHSPNLNETDQIFVQSPPSPPFQTFPMGCFLDGRVDVEKSQFFHSSCYKTCSFFLLLQCYDVPIQKHRKTDNINDRSHVQLTRCCVYKDQEGIHQGLQLRHPAR